MSAFSKMVDPVQGIINLDIKHTLDLTSYMTRVLEKVTDYPLEVVSYEITDPDEYGYFLSKVLTIMTNFTTGRIRLHNVTKVDTVDFYKGFFHDAILSSIRGEVGKIYTFISSVTLDEDLQNIKTEVTKYLSNYRVSVGDDTGLVQISKSSLYYVMACMVALVNYITSNTLKKTNQQELLVIYQILFQNGLNMARVKPTPPTTLTPVLTEPPARPTTVKQLKEAIRKRGGHFKSTDKKAQLEEIYDGLGSPRSTSSETSISDMRVVDLKEAIREEGGTFKSTDRKAALIDILRRLRGDTRPNSLKSNNQIDTLRARIAAARSRNQPPSALPPPPPPAVAKPLPVSVQRNILKNFLS